MMLIPWVMQANWCDYWLFYQYRGTMGNIGCSVSYSMLIALLILNWYWYILILKGLVKMLRNFGCLAPEKKSVEDKED